jgi:hypothetical protein
MNREKVVEKWNRAEILGHERLADIQGNENP